MLHIAALVKGGMQWRAMVGGMFPHCKQQLKIQILNRMFVLNVYVIYTYVNNTD